MPIPPRFDISAAEIDRVVACFYARIRHHETLGPVFNTHVKDWPAHEAKIAAFWRNAIMMEREYSGNPMQVHRARADVLPGHFTPWLAAFDTVLAEELPAESARAFSALAHRIGRGLRMGLVARGQQADGPPDLRSGAFGP
ncbi:MAG: group III truncated hemoglobin [Paracoccaceae bacterium]